MEEQNDLRHAIEEMKERFREYMEQQEQKEKVSLEKEGGAEIMAVETRDLAEKDLCAFKLYRALRDSGRAKMGDWQTFMKALEEYRKEIREGERAAGLKEFYYTKEMGMRDEFLAWLDNLALVEYSKAYAAERAKRKSQLH